LSSISADYPDFDSWLIKKLFDPKTSKKVAVLDKVVAAFSMWQAKDARNIKLQTFIVGQSYRGTAIGQHLLYHEIRTWASDPKLERVHVTISSAKSDLIAYFRQFGFRVEGFSPNRYPRKAAELILSKHFVRSVVSTSADMEVVAQRLFSCIWGLSEGSPSRFGVRDKDLAIPAFVPAMKMTVDLRNETVSSRIVLSESDSGREILRHDDESLMREFFPLRIHLPGKTYALVPIYQEWASAMLSTSGPHTPLKLRIDHVYYCYPKLSYLRTGDFVLFYETKTGGGRGAVIGAAVVQQVLISIPSALFAQFANLGVYALADIQRHANSAGVAMAIKFSLFEPFPKVVPLKDVRTYTKSKTTVQGLTRLSSESFERIRSQGIESP